jgi:hypothetical protein
MPLWYLQQAILCASIMTHALIPRYWSDLLRTIEASRSAMDVAFREYAAKRPQQILIQRKCRLYETGKYFKKSVAPSYLHLEVLATNHVQRKEDSAGGQTLEQMCKAIEQLPRRRFRTNGDVSPRHIDHFRPRAESMQQQFHLAGPERRRNKLTAKRELEESCKTR